MAWRNAARWMARASKDSTLRKFCTSSRLVAPPSPKPRQFAKWKIGGLVIGGLGVSIAAYSLLTKAPTEVKKQPQPIMPRKGPPSLGGPFKLTNKDGKVVTNEDFRGKWVLVYFGYTSCPEDCPKQLQKLADVIKVYETAGKEIVPIFITIDPERDNVHQLDQFVKEFHPKIVGLRGNATEIRPVLWEYRVYFKKTAEVGSDYLVEHSSSMYLHNKDMECVKTFGPEYGLEALIESINKEVVG